MIIAVLVVTMLLFVWGRLRHDVVALGALLACVFTGLVPGGDAFSGFGHPAVITVACVLVLGYGLQISGAVDVLAKRLLPASAGPTVSLLALTGLAAFLSSFMNNVGALALLMPIAIQMANKLELPAGRILMPLSFASILGGMTTLIGTPPNLIVSGYRENIGMGSFDMFDFTPVGLTVAILGVAFVALLGWRLVPERKTVDTIFFESGAYQGEVRVTADSNAVNKRLREVEKMLDDVDAQILAMVRNDVHISAPSPHRLLKEDDILVLEVDPASLSTVMTALGIKLEGEVPASSKTQEIKTAKTEQPDKNVTTETGDDNKKAGDDDTIIQELVVTPTAALIDRSARGIQLRSRYRINLLAISRRGTRTIKRLHTALIKAGDVLLMQGSAEALAGFAAEYGCLPLAGRDITVPKKGHALTASVIMLVSVAAAAMGVLSAAVAFAAGALAFVVLKVVPARSIYTTVDWPVVVLLAAMLPIAGAMSSTGAADMIAIWLLDSLAQGHAITGLILILVVTMLLTDFMNNAATAAVMCPIAISTAAQLGVNPDTFLMTVAVGASCAFLTPIGHQNNTLILGPGGFHFSDYWRMGLPTDLLVVVVSVPMILLVWPL